MLDIKPEKRLSKEAFNFFCVLAVFILLTSCSTAGTFSWFKFWNSPRVNSEVPDSDVVKFVSTIRPFRGNPDSHYLLANYYQKKGLHKKAIEEYKKVIAIDPFYLKAYNGLGVSYDHLGYFSKAIESYQTALSIDPKLDYVLNNLGYSYLKQGNYEAAVKVLEKAVALNNYDKRIRGNLGLAYDRSGKREKAFEEFKAAWDETTANYNISSFRSENNSSSKTKDHNPQSNAVSPLVTQANERLNLTSRESNAMVKYEEGEEVTHSRVSKVDNEIPLLATRENEDNSKIDFEEENLKLFISQLTSQGTTKEEIVNTSEQNEIKQDNLSQHAKVNLDSSLNTFGIEISNGNGVNRMARRIGKYLNKKGYHVVRLTNAANFNYHKTVISYQKDYLHKAHEVEQQLPGNHAIKMVAMHERPRVKIKVLIGKDIAKYNNNFPES